MKKIAAALLAAAMVISMTACQSQEQPQSESVEPLAPQSQIDSQPESNESSASQSETTSDSEESTAGNRILIAYFSLGHNAEYPDDVDASTSASLVLDNGQQYGTTEYMANLIQQNVGGDVHMIQTVTPYPADFDAVVDQNHAEMDAGTLPELVESDLDISQYDTVFIGYPIWATNAPQAIFSFLSEYDLSGKTVIPFCTHDGYGAGGSYADIAAAVPGAARVLDGLAIEASDVPGGAEPVAQWLQEIGMDKKAEENVQAEGTAITITVGDTVLDGVIYDTALAKEIEEYFPLTISMVGFGGREYYGGVDFYPENLEGGQKTFENGDITYCEAHHNMAIFYAQTDDPVLSVDVIPIGKVTSDLSVFNELSGNVDITFALAE